MAGWIEKRRSLTSTSTIFSRSSQAMTRSGVTRRRKLYQRSFSKPWIDIVSFALAVNLATVDDVAEVLLTPILQNLQAQGQIISQRTRRMKVGGFPAIRYDMVYQSRAGAEAEQGYMMAILGKRFALLAAVSARRSDEVNRHAGEAAMATLAIESTTPGKVPR